MEILTQKIEIQNRKVELYIRREDLIHPYVSGNKLRKLKYNIENIKENNFEKIITFGGAFSNHIAAVAYSGKINNLQTVGIIRGEELFSKIESNPTLQFAHQCGMQLEFVSREDYKNKSTLNFIDYLNSKFSNSFILPEGGTNEFAIKGCEEIVQKADGIFDFICCSVGTGGTISGIINKSFNHQKIIGFSSLKGDFLEKDIRKFAKKQNWKLFSEYHFGGYGKINSDLINFINEFNYKFSILLDPIYTGKMVFGVIDLINKNYFPDNSKILLIHTGGTQGITGMNMFLKSKKLPIIKI